MEYFQLEDMFGKRHRPTLALHLEEGRFRREGNIYERELTIGIGNQGRAVARFPSIRFENNGVSVNYSGIDGVAGSVCHGDPQSPNSSSSVEGRIT
jgi:hypothetical protein